MGRIKTAEIKKASFELVRSYPDKFSTDFGQNKEALATLNIAMDKSVRNKVVGYITRVKKRRA